MKKDECEIYDTSHLYHYYEKTCEPFRTITALPFEEALSVYTAWRAAQPNSGATTPEWYLNRRYNMEKRVRDKFIAIGGRPVRSAPVYFTLGANKGLETWYNKPAFIKIPIDEFDLATVSFTYGDMFPVFNASLDTGEEWWKQVFDYEGILKLIDKYGFPEDPEYNMKKRIFPFPEGKNIGMYLKFVEAHVWDDSALDKYRSNKSQSLKWDRGG
ncbi:MAG: hypothetical protein FWH48_03725 [Oscillospiraceae bacterium]|nr:hypothetical protein [Oscillospiraceae bacterium]